MEQLLNVHMVEQLFDAAFCFRPRAEGCILQTRHAADTCTTTCIHITCTLIHCQQRLCNACSGHEGAVTEAAHTAHLRPGFFNSQRIAHYVIILSVNNSRLSLQENQV